MRAMIAALSILLASGTAPAQQRGNPDTPPGSDVTVQGRTSAETRALVGRLIAPKQGRYIPAFRDSLCVKVQGLTEPYAGMLRTRIDTVAREAGLRVRPGACSPNLIVVTPVDADAMAERLVKIHPMLFGDPDYGMAPPSLLASMRQPHAVRWFETVQLLRWGDGRWRLEPTAQANKVAAYFILDTRMMVGMDWNSVADFVAMAALSNAKMDATYPAKTSILSLFEDRDVSRAGPSRLTSFDRSLLRALYAVPQNLTPDIQREQIVRMVEGKTPIPERRR